MSRDICLVTGSRADYGLMSRTARLIRKAGRLRLLATGSHLDKSAGATVQEIEADGFEIDARVSLPSTGGSGLDTARAIGAGVVAMADVFNAMRPGAVLLLGDRFETFAAAQAAFFQEIPVAHVHGGEVTLGSLDDSTRHAISKFARWHFTANAEARRRLIRMGETPENVFQVGAPGLDDLRNMDWLGPDDLARSLGWSSHAPFLLITYHPVTNEAAESAAGMAALLAVLSCDPRRIVITGANADAGGTTLNRQMADFAAKHGDRVRVEASLGRRRYLSAVRLTDAVVGNSSSGLIEVPFLKRPTVNIGLRQEGRPIASSVIQAAPDEASIAAALKAVAGRAFSARLGRTRSLYGDGQSSTRIAATLLEVVDGGRAGPKRFHDLVRSPVRSFTR